MSIKLKYFILKCYLFLSGISYNNVVTAIVKHFETRFTYREQERHIERARERVRGSETEKERERYTDRERKIRLMSLALLRS